MVVQGYRVFVTTLNHKVIEHEGIVVNENGVDYIYHITTAATNEWGGNVLRQVYSEVLTVRTELGRKEVLIDLDALHEYYWATRTITYNPATFNCEHFVSYFLEGAKSSPQLVEWSLKGLIATFFTLTVSYKIIKKRRRRRRIKNLNHSKKFKDGIR